MSLGRGSLRGGARCPALSMIVLLIAACLCLTGCGQSKPEDTVFKFLGAAQSHDLGAMRSCISPEALLKADEMGAELVRQQDELRRRYKASQADWRMEFTDIRVECTYLDPDRASVRLSGGTCELYDLKDGIWRKAGEIDFSADGFSPLYVTRKGGKWYLEALDLYIIYGLESLARI